MSITELLVTYITQLISTGGYPSVLLLMTLESMIAPVPSEAVMPFVGFLIHSGQFSWSGAIFWSTLGSAIGSFASYYLGAHGGRPLVEKYGKYLLLNVEHLAVTEHFFQKHGRKTVFLSRFIPVIRHFISIPAGVAKMPLWEFMALTIVGAGLWNTILTYVGFVLKEHWEVLGKYMKIGDVIVVTLLVIAVGYWFYKRFKKPSAV